MVGNLNTLTTELSDANTALKDERYQRVLIEKHIRQVLAHEANEAAARGGVRKLRKSSKVTS